MTDNELLMANAGLIAEEFDREIVLLDVVRGLYFSLGGAAAELWRAFGAPRSADEVVGALCGQLAGADSAALRAAVQSMRDNQVVVPAGDAPRVGQLPFITQAKEFSAPTVEVFSDLADLISIDPVHEVDAGAGWPVRPDNFPDVA